MHVHNHVHVCIFCDLFLLPPLFKLQVCEYFYEITTQEDVLHLIVTEKEDPIPVMLLDKVNGRSFADILIQEGKAM